jgi:hypothetical protein
MVSEKAADRSAERVLPAARGSRRSREQAVRVHFYTGASYDWTQETFRTRVEFLLWRVCCGPYVHCNVQVDEWLYDCSRALGCQIFPLELIPARPTVTVEIRTRIDNCAFMAQLRFELGKSILHILGLLPRGIPVMNCVQATRELLGVEEEARTPRELLKVLRR